MGNLWDIRDKKTPIQLGDTTKFLHYDLNAFAELESIYGTVEGAMHALSEGKISAIINTLWAGLLHEKEDLTRRAVGKMFDLSQIKAVAKLINTAIEQALPEASEDIDEKKGD